MTFERVRCFIESHACGQHCNVQHLPLHLPVPPSYLYLRLYLYAMCNLCLCIYLCLLHLTSYLYLRLYLYNCANMLPRSGMVAIHVACDGHCTNMPRSQHTEKTCHGHLPKVVSQNHIATRTASCDRSRLADGRATSKTPTSKRGMLKCTTCVRKQTQACTCHRHLSMTLAATRLWRAACPGCPIPTPCQTSWNPHPVTPGHALMH